MHKIVLHNKMQKIVKGGLNAVMKILVVPLVQQNAGLLMDNKIIIITMNKMIITMIITNKIQKKTQLTSNKRIMKMGNKLKIMNLIMKNHFNKKPKNVKKIMTKTVNSVV